MNDRMTSAHKALIKAEGAVHLPAIYLGPTGGLPSPDGRTRHALTRLKWIISTCVVGVAGISVIAVAMYASMNVEDGSGMLSSIRRASLSALKPQSVGRIVQQRTLAALGQKTDRIEISAKGITTRYIIHDTVVRRRASREFTEIKPYALIEASLSTSRPANAPDIPAINPFELYANKKSVAAQRKEEAEKADTSAILDLNIADLPGGVLPALDHQAISRDRAEQIVAEAGAVYSEADVPLSTEAEQSDEATDAEEPPAAEPASQALPANTTVLQKAPESDEEEVASETENSAVIVRPGDTLIELLKQAGAADWQAGAIARAMATVPGAQNLKVGQELRFTLAPASSDSEKKEPIRVSLFTGLKHEVTVTRNAAGDYVATQKSVKIAALARAKARNMPLRSTLYSGIYDAALAQHLPRPDIMKLLRINAYNVDYKRKASPGDGFKLFFDMDKDGKGEEQPSHLLYIALTVSGKTHAYYRFRTPDGQIDYYNVSGSNSRKFLMRKPVKGARFTSPFGMRRHPLLGTTRMHTGVDWAARSGTPVLAAGSGTVEFAGRRGGYGNRIRLSHGNGYQTTYSHLLRFAKGIEPGIKVSQGQVIAYVGTTGRSTGPHLHFEVLVNKRFTDPMKVPLPRGRQLKGRLLAEFNQERKRIDMLMHRAPVQTRVAAVNE